MKLHVENLGIIKEATIDIKPLTVIVGPNNTNKTWLAYCLYGLLDMDLLQNVTMRFIQKKEPFDYDMESELNLIYQQLINDGSYCQMLCMT